MLGLSGLVVAAAALVHSASEAMPLGAGLVLRTDTALSATANVEAANLLFRAELVEGAANGQTVPQSASTGALAAARIAFAVDPLDSEVLRILAIGATVDRASRSEAMSLVWALTKRDELVSLWLAENAGSQGDLDTMVSRFDAVMRTNERVREQAMPTLLNVLTIDEGIDEIGRLISRQPNWEPEFWHAFVRNPVSLSRAASFFERNDIGLDRLGQENRRRLYANLLAANEYAVLFSVAAKDETLGSPGSMADGTFDAARNGHPLDWTTFAEGRFSASISAENELVINSEPGGFGLAAQRIVPNTGPAQIGLALAQPVPDGAQVVLEAVCAGQRNSSPLARVTLDAGGTDGVAAIERADCSYIELRLSFTAPAGRRPTDLRVRQIQLS
ncbi:MAG: hypothetical protein JY451_14950 [Erythrobacter sp.]|nr:MAG: hypothetical protein JY451_14950 [Erythrobacter sp.]